MRRLNGASRTSCRPTLCRPEVLGGTSSSDILHYPEVAVLAEKGLISGVYITRHNVVGSTPARLKEEIAALQEKRRAAGLHP